jgi:hypothetical protein
MSTIDGRLMDEGRSSGGCLDRLGAVSEAEAGLVEATQARETSFLRAADRLVDVATREGDGGDGLARGAAPGENGQFVQTAQQK